MSSTGVSKQAFAVANVTVGFATQVIGLVGFEPTASWSRTRRSTKLSHSPNCSSDLPRQGGARSYFAYFATPGKRFSLPWHPISVKQAEFARVSPHARATQLALLYRVSKIGPCFLNPMLL